MSPRDETGSVVGVELLVMSRRGVQTFALPEHGELAIGRAAECDVSIEDEKASRRHAILRIGAHVELIDLGGKNGTSVDGRRLPPNEAVALGLDEVVTIGGAVLRLRKIAPSPLRVWTTAEYVEAFEQALARATRESDALALMVLAIQPTRRETSEATTLATTREHLVGAEVEASLAQLLRPGDIIAPHEAWSYRIVLCGGEPALARSIADKLGARLARSGIRAEIGLASFPEGGRTRKDLEHAADSHRAGVGFAGSARLASAEPEPALSSRAPSVSAARRELDAAIPRVAKSTINVVLVGETGVGKEVTASAIHAASARAKAPFVGINCAALSETLFESELFGYERGAFTGADRAKPGLFEAAEGGTLFFDEVGEMPLAIQAKFLRVLERREVLRLGSVRPTPIDVRILSATNRDLSQEVAAQRFRSDLYFRLNGVTIEIPPLRERQDEIGGLALEFIGTSCRESGRESVPTLAGETLAALRAHPWPGNIRELRNVIERALLLCEGSEVRPEHLSFDAPMRFSNPPPGPAASLAPDGPEEEEKRRIIDALERCVWNQTYAAEMLGISRRTLVSRLRKYGIARPRTRPPEIS